MIWSNCQAVNRINNEKKIEKSKNICESFKSSVRFLIKFNDCEAIRKQLTALTTRY